MYHPGMHKSRKGEDQVCMHEYNMHISKLLNVTMTLLGKKKKKCPLITEALTWLLGLSYFASSS